jgi:hypothetical protein
MASISFRGEHQWQVQIRRKGHSVAMTFQNKKEAEAWALKTEGEIDQSIFKKTNLVDDQRKKLPEEADFF